MKNFVFIYKEAYLLDLLELKANARTLTGKGPARRLRREGRVPAILYGPGAEPVMLSVGVSDVEHALKNSKTSQVLANLVIQNGENTVRSAMIKELQSHPLTGTFLHIDFYEIAADRKIMARVPVVAKGKSKGVELGGLLQIIRRELEVSCFPNQIPEAIEIDITDLDIGESVHVNEIALEGDVEIPTEVNFTVLTVITPKGAADDEEEGAEGEASEEAPEEAAAT